MNTVISPEEGEELRRLFAELEHSYLRGAALMRTGGHPLDGNQLAELLQEEAIQSQIVRRIKEIQGLK